MSGGRGADTGGGSRATVQDWLSLFALFLAGRVLVLDSWGSRPASRKELSLCESVRKGVGRCVASV